MASLATPSPKSKSPASVRDKWRAKTNYKSKRFTGYAPISYAMVAEVGRLTTGKGTQLAYVILTASLGQFTKPDQPFKESAADLRTLDLAELCGCDERTVQRELLDLKRREVILWEQTKKGINTVTPLFRHWSTLPDYTPAPVLEPEAEDEPEPDEPEEKAKVTTHITKTLCVRAGKTSKRFPVECGVSALQIHVRGKTDTECSAVVKDGVLRVILEAKWNGQILGGDLLQGKKISEKPRQGCRGFGANNKGTNGERRTESERPASVHPRAAELCDLFDPVLLKSSGESLSGDYQKLKAACEAIGNADHAFLAKRVLERSKRKLQLSHVKALCLEIARNWEKAKSLPPEKKLPTREEIDRIIERETRELAERRKKGA